jgi:predicted nucleotidyltransferase
MRITDHQRAVMEKVLREEGARREHVVVHLSGAHAYGFPSVDSDLDLKAIHVANTADLVGLEAPPSAVDRAEVIEGVEIDYSWNELGPVLSGVLTGNGNFIERVLASEAHPIESPLLEELAPIVERSLSRRVHKHYRGFAMNQRLALEKKPTVKKLLYVLRTAATGIHLLKTGEVEADLTRIMDRTDLSFARELIERKQSGERMELAPSEVKAQRETLDRLFARLDAARDGSVLADAPANADEVKSFLIDVRRRRFV